MKAQWSHLLEQLHAGGAGAAIYEELLALYGQPHRFYHNLSHIKACLAELENSPFAGEHAVALALWFHDAVYDPLRHDNEEVSAELAAARLASLSLDKLIPVVRQMVLITKHVARPQTTQEQIIVDIDLAILGRSHEEFAQYETAIRREYQHVPQVLFRAARATILQRILARARIYETDFFYAQYEKTARKNLKQSLQLLGES